MKISLIIFSLSFIIIQSSLCQETFFRQYDFFGGASETARNMEVIGNEVFIFGVAVAGCEEGFCFHFYKLDLDGDTIMVRRYPEIAAALRCDLRDSSIYVAGRLRQDTLESNDFGYRLFELDLDGKLIGTARYGLEDIPDPPGYTLESYLPIGAIANDDKIVVYGDTRELDANGDDILIGYLCYSGY